MRYIITLCSLVVKSDVSMNF